MKYLLLISLIPPFWAVFHSLVGLVLMLPYGVIKARWRAGALEVLAKKRPDGRTRIWFQPGAQTWGFVVFCADIRDFESESLQVHERVHVLQSLLFGVFYPVTYALSFAVLFAIVKSRLDWWDRGHNDDDIWHAYRMIPWEIWAYSKQRRFERGEFINAWGAK